jgi:hypothetical protein
MSDNRDQFRRSAAGPIISTLLGVYDRAGKLFQHDSLIVRGALVEGQDASPTAVSAVIVDLGHVDVREYGAVGDGVTDDTAAIQAAIDAAGASGSRRPRILFPPGDYLITAPLMVEDKGSGVGTLLNIAGGNAGGNSGVGDYATTITWGGGAGNYAVAMHTRNSTISNIAIRAADGSSIVTAVDIDKSAQVGSGICTGNTFKNVHVVAGRAGFGSIEHAFRIGSSGATNCEMMTFEDCGAWGISGVFMFIDNITAQSMQHKLVRCSCNSTASQSPEGFWSWAGRGNGAYHE